MVEITANDLSLIVNLNTLSWLIRYGFLLSMILASGTALAAYQMHPAVPIDWFRRRQKHWGILALVFTVAQVLVQVLQLGGGSLSHDALHIFTLTSLWLSGQLYLATAIILIITAALPAVFYGFRMLALPCFLYSLSLSGHISQLPSDSQIALALHALIALAWIGHLSALSQLLKTPNDRALLVKTMTQFSYWAIIVIPAGVIIGVYMANQLIHLPYDLLQTPYGQVLSIKSLAVSLTLALAGYNRFYLSRRLIDEKHSLVGISRTIRFESILLIGITLSATTWMTNYGGTTRLSH